jgi:putative transposase
MIDRSHELPLARQAKALGISRGSVYYLARPTSNADLALVRRIDALHLEHPFAGSRMLQKLLKAEGCEGGRLHVSTLMKSSRDRRASGAAQARRTAIEAIYRRPNTSTPSPGHKIHPCLLRNLAVTRPNQAWGEPLSVIGPRTRVRDITSVPMARARPRTVYGWRPRDKRSSFGFGFWSVAAMYTASHWQLFGCAP